MPLSNTEAQAFIRAYENQRVEDYEAWERDGGNAWEGYDFPKPKYDGPSRNKPMPEVIPYEELEEMALEHARQLASGVEREMLRRYQQTEAPEADLTESIDEFLELPLEPEWEDTPLTAEPKPKKRKKVTSLDGEDTVIPPEVNTVPPVTEEKRTDDVPVAIETPVEQAPPVASEVDTEVTPVAEPVIMPDKPVKVPKPDATRQTDPPRRSGGTLYGKRVQKFLNEQEKKEGKG